MSQFTTFGDRYDVGQRIGHGGMAEVFEATDRRLSRRVAIKVLRTELARDPLFLERFRREAQSAAGLNHPNIVGVYDTGEQVMTFGESEVVVPYIVMEHVDGVTLRHMLQSGPRILPERGLEIVAGILAALDYAHRNGIVHRDIKPANVMINAHGDAKVMDFGIARAMSDTATSVTATSAVMGTAQYLSPEQARGEVADARSDIYACGCVLYELLTGRPPFVGDSPVSIAYQHVNETPQAPSSLDPAISAALDAITLHALAKNPATRYQTAAEMRADVERAMAGMPINVQVITASETTALPVTTAITPPVTQTAIITPNTPGPVVPPALPLPAHNTAPKAGRGKVIGGALAVLTAIAVILFGSQALLGSGNDKVTVPSLANMTVEEATNSLINVQLILGEKVTAADANAPEGTIISQDPAAGELLDAGQPVNIVVSSGPEQVDVPNLVKMVSVDDARAALETKGLVLGKVTEQDSVEVKGQVIEQSPLAGETVAKGSTVDIVISNGKIELPDVVNSSKTQAKNDLMNLGFVVDVIYEETPDFAAGTVIAQSPKAGEFYERGTTITITVAKAPPTPTTPATPLPTAT